MEFDPWMNRNMNKYLRQEIVSLISHRPKSPGNYGNPEKFWATADRLLNSWVYIVASMGSKCSEGGPGSFWKDLRGYLSRQSMKCPSL